MMDKLLQHPTWLKVFSLVLALLLWAVVMENVNVVETQSFDVQLQVLYNPDYEVFEGPHNLEQTVTVRATGRKLVVSRFRAEQFGATVDLAKIPEPGKATSVDIGLTRVPRQPGGGLEYNITPKSVIVTLMETAEISVPVVVAPARSTITAADGREYEYTVSTVEEQVRVRGRADLVKNVRQGRLILDMTDLDPRKTSFTKAVVLAGADGVGIDKVPAPIVNVQLTWRELPPGKAFKVQPITTGTLPSGLVVTRVDVEPASLTVRAATLGGKLPEREILETEPIDITGRLKTFTTTARVVVPAGTSVVAPTVNVTVNLAESQVEKIFKGIPLTVHGKGVNAEVTTQVTDVQIRVKGPYSVVTPMDAGGLAAFVDVEAVTAGRHTLPVKVTYPSELTAVTVDPAVVEVEIRTLPPVTP